MNDRNCFIEIRGNREVLIDGAESILEYSEEKIVILIGRLKLTIKGKRLNLLTMNEGRISVEGFIEALEYNNNEKISS